MYLATVFPFSIGRFESSSWLNILWVFTHFTMHLFFCLLASLRFTVVKQSLIVSNLHCIGVSHSRTRDFSRVTQDLSTRIVVSRRQPFSHHAQHVARALVDVSFTFEHYFIFHMHSSSTFYPTIYPTFVVVHFAPRFSLHRSIECDFRPWQKPTVLQVTSPKMSLKRTPLHWSNRCSSTHRARRRLIFQLRILRLFPLESDLDDEQIRKMLASPLYL